MREEREILIGNKKNEKERKQHNGNPKKQQTSRTGLPLQVLFETKLAFVSQIAHIMGVEKGEKKVILSAFSCA